MQQRPVPPPRRVPGRALRGPGRVRGFRSASTAGGGCSRNVLWDVSLSRQPRRAGWPPSRKSGARGRCGTARQRRGQPPRPTANRPVRRWGRQVPPIQTLVSNKSSGCPGKGIAFFAPDAKDFERATRRGAPLLEPDSAPRAAACRHGGAAPPARGLHTTTPIRFRRRNPGQFVRPDPGIFARTS